MTDKALLTAVAIEVMGWTPFANDGQSWKDEYDHLTTFDTDFRSHQWVNVWVRGGDDGDPSFYWNPLRDTDDVTKIIFHMHNLGYEVNVRFRMDYIQVDFFGVHCGYGSETGNHFPRVVMRAALKAVRSAAAKKVAKLS